MNLRMRKMNLMTRSTMTTTTARTMMVLKRHMSRRGEEIWTTLQLGRVRRPQTMTIVVVIAVVMDAVMIAAAVAMGAVMDVVMIAEAVSAAVMTVEEVDVVVTTRMMERVVGVAFRYLFA